MVAPDHQGGQGGFAFGGRLVALRLHGRPEVAQDDRIEYVGLGQASLGTGEGAHPGRVVHADRDRLGLQRGDDGALVAAGALAHDVGRTPGLEVQTAQVGEQGPVTRWSVWQGEGAPGQIDLQRELGNVEAEVDSRGSCGDHGWRLFLVYASWRTRRRSGNCSSSRNQRSPGWHRAVDGQW